MASTPAVFLFVARTNLTCWNQDKQIFRCVDVRSLKCTDLVSGLIVVTALELHDLDDAGCMFCE